MALRTVGVRLVAEIADYQSKMRAAGQSTRQFVGEMGKAASAGKLDAVTNQAAALGVGLAGMAGFAVKSAADFDKAMSQVRAATHAGAAEIDKLRTAALQAGKDTSFSATEAADGITELSKAGVSTADVLNGGLRGALDLAAAGQLSVGEAAETAASAMTQFRLDGGKVPHIADLLAAAAGKAQGSVHDMGFALQQSGLVASQFGLSVEDTTGALAAFASAGLTGSDAGTSFKTMLLALANPAEKTRDLMEDLGIQAYDAQGQFVGITNLAGQLQQKLGGLTQAQRDAALAQIFGSDAIRTANVLYQQGATGIQQWIDKVNDAGYASETARIQTDNLAGDIERLKGSIETLAIESGSGANGGLRKLVQIADTLVDRFSSLPPAVGSSLTVLAGLSGAALLLAAGWLKARRTSAEFRAELEAMGPAGERAASGLSKVGSAAGKIGAAFAALQVAGAVINQFQGDLNPQLDALAAGLERYASSGALAGESSRLLGGDLDKLQGQFQILADTAGKQTWARNIQSGLESIVPGLNKTDTSLANTKERVSAIDSALANLVQGGKAQQANDAFNRLASVLATGGVSMAEFRKQFPQYAAALEVAKTQTAGAAGATKGLTGALDAGQDAQKDFKTATDAAAAATRGQRSALSQLAAFMKGEVDPVFGFIEAQKALKTASDKAAAAIKNHGRKSEEAKAATRDLALAAIDLQGKAGALGETFDGKVTPSLRKTLHAAGLTDAEIKILEQQFKDAKKAADKYDGKYEAKASAPGAKQAKTDLDKAYTAANHFAGPYRADVSVTGYSDAIGKLNRLSVYQQALKKGKIPPGFNGPIKGPDGKYYAEGGWTGPGEKWQPAGIVHADEYVIKKDSRRRIEAQAPGLLDAMNTTGSARPPGYDAGGRVLPYPVNARGTRIPSRREVSDAVIPGFPGGGHTSDWIVSVVKRFFPGLAVLSQDRPGAMTLTGNRSYHSMGRAVDFTASRALAEFWNAHYMARTKELITPWQSLNIQNGRRHAYSPIVYNQHNFAGGNPHDHIAMGRGGVITEPIFGVGASGRTYSLGENYTSERVTPNWRTSGGGSVSVTVVNQGVIGSRAEAENFLVGAIDNLKRKGRI